MEPHDADTPISFWGLLCNLDPDDEAYEDTDIGEALRACSSLRHVKVLPACALWVGGCVCPIHTLTLTLPHDPPRQTQPGRSRAWVRQALNLKVFDISLHVRVIMCRCCC